MTWDEESVEMLKMLWRAGLSGAEIALQMGMGLTASAVLGKVNRLDLPARRERKQKQNPEVIIPPACEPSPPRQIMAGANVVDFPIERRFLLTEEPRRTQNSCSWPIGDPNLSGFRFCGCPCEGPFCNVHREIAYQPAQSKTSATELARALRRYI